MSLEPLIRPARAALALLLLAALPLRAQAPGTGASDLLERATFGLAAGLGALAAFDGEFSAPQLAAGGAGSAGPAPFDAAALARLAEEGNPGLAGARAALAGAGAELRAAEAKRLPAVAGSLSATGIANPMDAIEIPAGAFGVVPMPLPPTAVTIMEAGDPFYWKAMASLRQPLFTWGKLAAGIDMARAGREAARFGYEKARRELLLGVGARAESLAILQRLDEVLGLQAAIGDRLVYISAESRKAGFITQAELIQARIDVKEVDLARAEIVQRRELLLQELRGLTGRPGLSFAELAVAAPAAGKPRLPAAELAAAARRGSVDLALVASLERLREAGGRLARGSRALLPDLGLQVELSYAGSRIPLLQDSWQDKNDWSLNLSLAGSVALYDGGAARAALDRAAAELDGARAQARAAEAGIDALVRSALLDLDLARLRLEYDVLKLEGHRETVTSLRAERDAGSGSEAAYLRALLDSLRTVADGWSRLAEYRAALWKLEAALP